MLRDFDTADPSVACPRRERSNTPLQALTLLNDPAFTEFARALGLRLVREVPGGRDSRVGQAFRIALARAPDREEAEITARVYEEQRALYDSDADATAGLLGGQCLPARGSPPEAAAWIAVARTVLNLDEFIARE